jgi:predicted RecA/RadA family phage recombinase
MQPRFIPSSPTPKLSRFNGTNADIGANLVVMKDASYADGIKLPTGIDAPIEGVTMNVIKAGEWGDIVVAAGSIVPVKNTGGITAGDRLMPQTDGTVATFSASSGSNASVVGIAQYTAATGVVEEMLFTAPGASRQG